MWPKNVLMVSPDFFEVQYSINPYMVDSKGELEVIDPGRAMGQWLMLKNTFEHLGLNVVTEEGAEGLPDMVFCANPLFPFQKNGVQSMILSRMHSDFRKPEVEHLRLWALRHNIKTYSLSASPFEGMGDLLWDYETGRLFGGYGFRSAKEAYDEIEPLVETPIVRLSLQDPRFYHLDTCLSILGGGHAAYVPEAFDADGLKQLEAAFETLISIPVAEALSHFAGNCFSPNGKDVIIQRDASQTKRLLEAKGFRVIEIDTSEFLKAGGSVFCMKLMY